MLVAAIVAALVWANISTSSYTAVWETDLGLQLGHFHVVRDVRDWINSGLMTLFFLVVGLEARREFDLGELRVRRNILLPVAVGLCAMIVPALLFVAVNVGGSGIRGWGVAMSTDTALALGLLSLFGSRVPARAKVFVLTVFVVDDLAALAVIAVVYSQKIVIAPVVAALVVLGLVLLAQRLRLRSRLLFFLLGLIMWSLLLVSGVDPIVTGLALGLTLTAYTPARPDLDRATGLVREFREQPTPELARIARTSLTATLSPNDRLQFFFHPWTSYVIVPLFALANAGIVLNGSFLVHAYAAPVTIGVLVAYLVGKPVAVVGTSWVISRVSHDRIRPPVGWASVLGSGTIAGIGFTVALLIASRAFTGDELAEAKLGALTAALLAAVITWFVYQVTWRLPHLTMVRALLGVSEDLLDLDPPVEPTRDHIRGPAEAAVTVVEYGDFQCPYCGLAESAVRQLLADTDVRYVWRHLPLRDVHPQAQLAAEAAEAAAAQDAFWPMHDLLLTRQDQLSGDDLVAAATELGLDARRFTEDMEKHKYLDRIAADVDSAEISGVSGTPTFFINGRRHYGAYDIATLTKAVDTARLRAQLTLT